MGSSVFAQTPTISAPAKPRGGNIDLKQKMIQRIAVKHGENQELNEIIKAKRADLAAEIKANREEFRLKLQALKDMRKKNIAERADQKLQKANQKSTNHFTQAIEKLEKLLQKFSDRAEKLKQEGQNTSEVDAAIAAAESAIAQAKEAVTTQGAKEYTADITDADSLKREFGEEMSTLRNDLKLTHDTVKLAKQKVIDVARALAKLESTKISPTVQPSI